MSCRTVVASATPATFPPGGSSHGSTCCVCARPITMVDPGNTALFLPMPYIRVYVPGQSPFHDEPPLRPQIGPRIGQVCSESCAGVYAGWVGEIYTWAAAMPLCPAHHCTKVIWSDFTMEETSG